MRVWTVLLFAGFTRLASAAGCESGAADHYEWVGPYLVKWMTIGIYWAILAFAVSTIGDDPKADRITDAGDIGWLLGTALVMTFLIVTQWKI